MSESIWAFCELMIGALTDSLVNGSRRLVRTGEDYPFYDLLKQYGETPSTYWTDVFLYWVDDPEVEAGAVLAFFSDLNPENTDSSKCYRQF